MSRLSPSGDARRPWDGAVVPLTSVHDAAAQAAADPIAGKTVAEILGEITWLMTQDPSARHLQVSEIERIVMPAILLRRFHIDYASTGGAAPLPLRVRIWAGTDDRTVPTFVAEVPDALPRTASGTADA